MAIVSYEYDKVSGYFIPAQYPIKKYEDMKVPTEIAKDFNQLTALIEEKYTREFLKVCAFYNKLFPSLKAYDWSRSSYNVIPFTTQDQERTDTGTGISSNYLKSVIDLVVARIGNTGFEYKLTADQPTALYTIYKTEIERILKSIVKKNRLKKLATQCFHDAAILAFSHCFIDPWTHELRKVNDWEVGCYESEFSGNHITRCLIRDFAFPVSALHPYLEGFPQSKIDDLNIGPAQIDLRLYIDTNRKKKWVAINSDMGPETDYPFDTVLMESFSWDIGIRETTVTSLFDLLYPLQRALNKLLAKKTQLLNNYKGPVPVFSHDAEIIVKALSNGAGEALFLDTQRDPATVVTTIEPTPLDPQMNAEAEALKAQMFELAMVQQMSMDLENYRSAAAVIALDQMRDAGFQSQLSALAEFIRNIIDKVITYMDVMHADPISGIEWSEVRKLLDDSYIDIVPVHDLDASGKTSQGAIDPDYMQMLIDKFISGLLKGRKTFEDMDYTYDVIKVYQAAAMKLVELRSIDGAEPTELDRLVVFLVQAFVDQVRNGVISLTDTGMPTAVGVDGQ